MAISHGFNKTEAATSVTAPVTVELRPADRCG